MVSEKDFTKPDPKDLITTDEYIRAWQQRVGEVTAHLKFHEQCLPKEILYNEFEKGCFGNDFNKKSVVDFGCGGGLFAEWLLHRYSPKEFTGYDIAFRSIAAAVERLQETSLERLAGFYIIPPDAFDAIRNLYTDYFVCFSVIQHFPDIAYFNNFFQALNSAGIKKLLLQIRHGGKTEFREEPYKTTHDIANACRTNAGELKKLLTNYRLTGKSAIDKKSKYQYLEFEKI